MTPDFKDTWNAVGTQNKPENYIKGQPSLTAL